MIVKNEQAMLASALETVKEADEIVICDTGSEDDTVEIAKKYTDKVYTDYQWEDHFAKARNHSLSKCTGDWVLIIDADEQLIDSFSRVRDAIKIAEEKGCHFVKVRTLAVDGSSSNMFPRIFKRIPEIKWYGPAHNYLADESRPIPPEHISDIVIKYGYSPAHKLDPDRTLRILSESFEKGEASSREIFYLAREYYYRKDYRRCIEFVDKYNENPGWRGEAAEAWLMKSRCHWFLKEGEEARLACMRAIYTNPDFKEAFVLMSEMNYEPRKSKWLLYSKLADSKDDILFVRDMSNAYK